MQLKLDEFETPIGVVSVVTGGDALCALDFADCRERMMALLESRFGRVELLPATDPGGHLTRTRAYFEGDLHALGRAAVDPGGTPFQCRVWKALRKVRAGRTASYGEVATSIGRPGAARAVGAANASNPVALAIPCHRIIGANGALTGYAGGIERKKWLLHHEGARLS